MNFYEVFPYSKDAIIQQINKRVSEVKLEYLQNKNHIKYFDKYLKALQASTVVCEIIYVDKDYLEDYSAYYVRTFHDYKRQCSRLHFFSNKFTKTKFTKFLKGENIQDLNGDILSDNYLGFIVIKPLPQTVFGRTCLKTYEDDGVRQYPIIRKYKVNLFGIDLQVDTIAYQEQDKTVAACASSAIWSAFQGTGLLFQHNIPSPVEITKAATKNFPHANRHFPNEGLTAEQMAQAIRDVRLEPYLVNCRTENFDNLTSTIYAYLKGKIPMIFGLYILHPKKDKEEEMEILGQHAVTVTGMGLEGNQKKFQSDDFYLKSSRMTKIYVHDDQVGNFAKMELNGGFVNMHGHNCVTLTSSFTGTEKARAVAKLIVVPLYHKIRIPFNSILKIILKLDEMIKAVCSKIKAPADFEWDIFLSNVCDFREDIKNSFLDGNIKHDILTKDFPKYIWRAICIINNVGKYELVFDATDIEQGRLILTAIDYDKNYSMPFIVFAASAVPEKITNLKVREIVEEIRRI